MHEAVTSAAGECSRGRRCCVPVVGFGAAEKHVAAGGGGVCVRCPWDPRAPRTCRRVEQRVAGPAARAVAPRRPGVAVGLASFVFLERAGRQRVSGLYSGVWGHCRARTVPAEPASRRRRPLLPHPPLRMVKRGGATLAAGTCALSPETLLRVRVGKAGRVWGRAAVVSGRLWVWEGILPGSGRLLGSAKDSRRVAHEGPGLVLF